ncbi:MarR family transcriptional regulator [Bacillus shivajii]|uniref:MarR family winged helix-turn-helix transcriptional regulator n=1 Tax=Bacillus shivajii TaxID=1983719 RepID=UPI001CFC2B7B|nr:MarR family transcriptional regulator [Bacillus shivajii]UCZ55069.1 MarR family transcriptional regulator [Bacillus shivajii]
MSSQREKFATSYLIFGLIRGLNFEIENDIRQVLKNNELTFPGFRVLWILYFDPNISMKELTFLAQTNISNVFRQLMKLKEDELVIIENDDDARIKKLSLTEEGKNIVQHFITINTTDSILQIMHVIDKIPKQDLQTFVEVSSFLSDELIGKKFGEFITKSSSDIISEPTSKT